MGHPGPDVPARLGVDLGGGEVGGDLEGDLQRPLLLAGEGVPVAGHRQGAPAQAVIVLPGHLGDVDVVGHHRHGVPLVDDALGELVLGLQPVGAVDDGGHVQPQGHLGAPLAEDLVGAEVAQAVGGGAAAEAVAPLGQLQGDVPVGRAVHVPPALGPAAQANAVEHQLAAAQAAGAGDGVVALLVRGEGPVPLIGEEEGVPLGPDGGEGLLPLVGGEGPAGQGGVGQVGCGLGGGEAALLPQLHLHLAGTGQGEGVVLAQGEAVPLEVLTLHGAEEGHGPFQVHLLDHLGSGVGVEEGLEPGGGGLDAPPGLVDDVLTILVLGEELGALGHRHRRLHRVVGGELEQTGGAHRVGHAEAGEA